MERTIIHPLAHSRPRRHTGLFDRLRQMREIRRQRRALSELSGHLLKDIGISADEARRESERPAWDVPSHWLR
ncbi:DUF1127 domain-containing protein [Defluviimonas sp. CAU 1641]|uniref:DUF1127 domain-containing protein n=1 Tax=Defluviimonas salinarum TaxID=2992147 RepID=A0ABT3J389_9RHOB|nr:DUF1127 domain-containing protein [Defluviimonas salinarum]